MEKAEYIYKIISPGWDLYTRCCLHKTSKLTCLEPVLDILWDSTYNQKNNTYWAQWKTLFLLYNDNRLKTKRITISYSLNIIDGDNMLLQPK